MASQAQKAQQSKMKGCARQWKAGGTSARSWRSFLKTCLSGGTGGSRKTSKTGSRARKSAGGGVRSAKAACKRFVEQRLQDPYHMGTRDKSTIMQNCLRRAANPANTVSAASDKPAGMRLPACKRACDKEVAVKQADPYMMGKSAPATMHANCMRKCTH